jgi:aldose sugar dehydrogenase
MAYPLTGRHLPLDARREDDMPALVPTRSALSRRVPAVALAALATASACSDAPAAAQDPVHESERHAFRVVTVAEGLQHPWGIAFLPGGDLVVTERPGRLRVVRGGVLQPEPVAGVPEVWARGQGGLLDVALHPDFASNRLVYLSYSRPGPRGATTAVVRGRLDGDRLTGVEDVIEADAWNQRPVHFGSRLVFDRDGYLYVTVGDRGEMARAQDRGDHVGSTLRLHDDGRVPADNPFVGEAGARPEVYTYGNRNAQGMAVHPVTGQVWQAEHGPRGGDEINLILPGRNYGWPAITHGVNYDGSVITPDTAREGMEQPLHHWTPSIAVAGMTVYGGNAFPGWQGNVFAAALAGEHVARLEFDGTTPVREERLLGDLGHRFRQVVTGPDGHLYLLVDARSAPVLRLEPAGGR